MAQLCDFMKADITSLTDNSALLECGRRASDVVNEICQPLARFGITIFTYCRIFNDGKRLYICSDKNWFEHYITQGFQDNLEHLEHYVPADGVKYALWSQFKMDPVFSDVYHKFHYWHGMTIYEKNPEFVDYFDFGTHRDNVQMINFYCNNLEVFTRFTDYFKCRAAALIDSPESSRLIIPRLQISLDEVPRTSTEVNKKKRSRVKNLGLTLVKNEKVVEAEKKHTKEMSLTEKEKECLNFYLDGKNISEISQILSLPECTIEFYLESVKLKINGKTRENVVENCDIY